MTGKELKDFAGQVHDDAEIEVRETDRYSTKNEWNRNFDIQAPLAFKKKEAVP